jgi:hypothetical protein
MRRAPGLAILVACIGLGAPMPKTQLPKRLTLALFPNQMRPLGANDAGIRLALSTNTETEWCEADSLLRGAFTSTTAREVIVNLRCAEAHADNYGSTALLSRQNGVWKFVWREPGLITRHCTRIRFAGGRDSVLCRDFFSMMGSRERYLYTIDFAGPPKRRHGHIVGTADTMGSGNDRVTQANIQRVTLGDPLVVWIRHGTAKLTQAASEAQMVSLYEPPPIATKLYRLEYVLRQNRYEPTPASLKMIRLLKLPRDTP